MKPLMVFDMDGVLVDVTESYRETIAQTVEHFTGVKPTPEIIQACKNEGGFNDDWKLSHHLVQAASGETPFEAVKEYFQSIFLGDNGLMQRERWVAQPGVLEKLNEQFRFAVFTGRPKEEAEMTLRRFAPDLIFDPIHGMEQVANRKPAPDGLLEIVKANCDCKVIYVGDTVDDARCARAANVPFVGIAAPWNPLYLTCLSVSRREAHAIVDTINYLSEVFPQ